MKRDCAGRSTGRHFDSTRSNDAGHEEEKDRCAPVHAPLQPPRFYLPGEENVLAAVEEIVSPAGVDLCGGRISSALRQLRILPGRRTDSGVYIKDLFQ